MAEKLLPKVFAENSSCVEKIDCAVCLQPCVHPTVLPCGHVFCYLCVKGLGRTTQTCAMCRQQFSANLLENPVLLRPVNESLDSGFDDGFQWYYEGRNGWWQYDERTSCELENAYKGGSPNCEVFIAGRVYVIDFGEMEQRQKTSVMRSRKIKRDRVSIPKKGISGIRVPARSPTPTNDDADTGLASLNLLEQQDE